MKSNIYPSVKRTDDMSQNQVESPGTVEQRALVGALIMSHPYYSDIWTDTEIRTWIDGTTESVFLNTLYKLYFAGQIDNVWNLIWSHGQHNLQNPLWTQWGQGTAQP